MAIKSASLEYIHTYMCAGAIKSNPPHKRINIIFNNNNNNNNYKDYD